MYPWNLVFVANITALNKFPTPITTNRIIPGIKKSENGEFFNASTVIPIGSCGFKIAAMPPNIAPTPTKM
jgi:hypothetical protein